MLPFVKPVFLPSLGKQIEDLPTGGRVGDGVAFFASNPLSCCIWGGILHAPCCTLQQNRAANLLPPFILRGKPVVAAQKFCAAAAAAASCYKQQQAAADGTLWRPCGAPQRIAALLPHLVAHLRRNSAIAADFKGKNSCTGVKISRHRHRHKPRMIENACYL